ncbi:DUF2325 domain-containing protein [Variovorax sp. KK3]|uniref:DUF2325 domain-containing protein n=1 Tax=Variovorax sp. KK3 TaxID=1855728 RepID=UPI00211895E2|nr:DUF2325 domain-containing protein [Variovorax sp. KK3]
MNDKEMPPSTLGPHGMDDMNDLVVEHRALLRHYGQVQLRCGELVRAQAAEIDKLRAEAIRLRAAVIVRDTALAWQKEQCTSLDVQVENLSALHESLVAADLVICQTGCLSHGAYWRVQDMCRRTGKACVLVEEPDAVRIVRLQKPVLPEPHGH